MSGKYSIEKKVQEFSFDDDAVVEQKKEALVINIDLIYLKNIFTGYQVLIICYNLNTLLTNANNKQNTNQ